MKKQSENVIYSSNSDEWGTPVRLYNKINKMYGPFTLDPCSDEWNAKCEKFYTKEGNGLTKSWKDKVVFCNPPYTNNQIVDWLKKGIEEIKNNGCIRVVYLIPSRTSNKWWHDYVMKHASIIDFIKGRVKFDRKNKDEDNHGAPFPSVVVVFDEYNNSDIHIGVINQ